MTTDRAIAGERWAEGRYLLQRELGRGAMGVVYQALDTVKGVDVALKTLFDPRPALLYRLKQEVRLLADVAHPNLVSVYELGVHDDRWFFSMEFIEGRDFMSFVRPVDATMESPAVFASVPLGPTVPTEGTRTFATGSSEGSSGRFVPYFASASLPSALRRTLQSESDERLPLAADLLRLRQAVVQLVEGVQALHSRGLLHRDLKPSNVLVTPEGRVVLLDFGVMTRLGHGDEHSVAGTVPYMAPEAVRLEALSSAADWYSVGVMIYEALTGVRPIDFTPNGDLSELAVVPIPPPEALVEGVPPDLSQIVMHLLRPHVADRATYADVTRALGAPSSEVGLTSHSGERQDDLAGRESHLEALTTARDAAFNGGATLTLVHGRSGMGKTALMQHFLQAERERGTVVLSGRCYEQESVPYKSVDALIDALAQHLRAKSEDELLALLPADMGYAARVFPVFAQLPIVAERYVGDVANALPNVLRRRAFAAIRDLLHALGAHARLILSIDDLQWGDLDSLPLLRLLVAPDTAPRMMLVATYRDEEAHESPLLKAILGTDEREDAVVGTRIAVDALNESESESLIFTLSQDVALDRDTRAVLIREAEGSPYFLREMVAYLAHEIGDDTRAMTLEDVLASRVAKLSERERRFLEMVAVAGRPERSAMLADLVGATDGGLSASHTLRAARLITSHGRAEHERVECYHDRIRETVYSLLTPHARKAAHLRLARAHAAAESATADIVSEHFWAAGEWAESGTHALVAAEEAVFSLAFERALTMYDRVLDERVVEASGWARSTVNDHRRARGQVLVNAGRSHLAAREFEALAHEYSGQEALSLRRLAGQYYITSGHPQDGLALLREVMASVGMRLPRTASGTLLGLLFLRVRAAFRGLRFVPRRVADLEPDAVFRVDACWAGAISIGLVDNFLGAYFLARGLVLTLDLGERERIARALCLESGFVSIAGASKAAKARKLLETAEAVAEGVESPYLAQHLAISRANYHFQTTADYEAVHRYALQALRIVRTLPSYPYEQVNAYLYAMWPLFFLGRISELAELGDELLDIGQSRGDRFATAAAQSGLPSFRYLAKGDPLPAIDACREVLDTWGGQGPMQLPHTWALVGLAHGLMYAGDPRGAYDAILVQWSAMSRALILSIDCVASEVRHTRARAALCTMAQEGSSRRLLKDVRAQAHLLKRRSLGWKKAVGTLLEAGWHAARGDARQAQASLVEGERLASASGLRLFALSAAYQRALVTDDTALREQCAEAIMACGVTDPAKIANLLVPCAALL